MKAAKASENPRRFVFLWNILKKRRNPPFSFVSPAALPFAKKIREILLSPESADMTPECEAYLYAAARAQLLREVVIPALNEGKIVICDRHVDSSVAYQGAGRGLGADVVKNINAKAIEGCPIDATVFIDLPHDKMFRSRKKAEELGDRFEVESGDFHARVYKGFSDIADENPERVIRIVPCECKAETSRHIIDALREKGLIR
ncbi:MAG: dTMP kinase [Clostridium sp.]|nr:MAG: dTMP kinase [Clostridium sp.]